MKSLSRIRLLATPWTAAYQVPLPMGFSRQGYWSGLPFPSPGDLPDPGIEPGSPALEADALTSEPPGKPTFGIYPVWPLLPTFTLPLVLPIIMVHVNLSSCLLTDAPVSTPCTPHPSIVSKVIFLNKCQIMLFYYSQLSSGPPITQKISQIPNTTLAPLLLS